MLSNQVILMDGYPLLKMHSCCNFTMFASDELHRKASRVVNVETVRRYNDLRDEAEIYRFFRFCNMSDEYIVSSNEYVVYQQLLACYQRYCEMEK